MLLVIESTADVFRVLNLALCVAVAASMAFCWRAYLASPRDEQFLRLSVGAYTVALTIGTVETLIHTPAPGVRTYLFTLALVWSLLAIWLERRDNR